MLCRARAVAIVKIYAYLIEKYDWPLQEPPRPGILIHRPVHHARASVSDIRDHQGAQSTRRQQTEAANLDFVQLHVSG